MYMKMYSVEQLVKEVTKSPDIRVYTMSKHKRLITKLVNDMVFQYPQHDMSMKFIASYPLIKWAEQARYKIGFSSEHIADMCKRDKIDREEYHMVLIKEMTKYMNDVYMMGFPFFNDYQDKVVSVHFHGKKDCSKYLINTYYFDAIRELCNRLDQRMKEWREEFDWLKRDVCLDEYINEIYHDIKQLRTDKMRGFNEVRKMAVLKNINMSKYNKFIKSAVKALKNYPFESDVYMCTKLFFDGLTDMEIARKINKSTKYVRPRYEEGLYAIAAILFGCDL